MKTLYVVMGADGTRKSSTIRTLTGIRVSSMTTVDTLKGIMDVYVQLCSPQEKGFMPCHLLKQVIPSNATCVLMALWLYENAKNNTPGGIEYINYFVNHGWTAKGIAVLGGNVNIELKRPLPQPLCIPNTQLMPANAIAAQIRNEWQWK